MGSHDPMIASMIKFALEQILDFAIGKSHSPHHSRASSMLYGCCDTGDCELFHQFFDAHRLSYLTHGFRPLIFQPKGLYSTALLSSICAPWTTGTFWYCFTSSTMLSWQKFCHIGHFTESVPNCICWDIFIHYWFSCAVMLGASSLVSGKLMTLMELSFALVVVFILPVLLFVLFCPNFWCVVRA